jgi:hypothetical protein
MEEPTDDANLGLGHNAGHSTGNGAGSRRSRTSAERDEDTFGATSRARTRAPRNRGVEHGKPRTRERHAAPGNCLTRDTAVNHHVRVATPETEVVDADNEASGSSRGCNPLTRASRDGIVDDHHIGLEAGDDLSRSFGYDIAAERECRLHDSRPPAYGDQRTHAQRASERSTPYQVPESAPWAGGGAKQHAQITAGRHAPPR